MPRKCDWHAQVYESDVGEVGLRGWIVATATSRFGCGVALTCSCDLNGLKLFMKLAFLCVSIVSHPLDGCSGRVYSQCTNAQ